jgi:hypothetical protein
VIPVRAARRHEWGALRARLSAVPFLAPVAVVCSIGFALVSPPAVLLVVLAGTALVLAARDGRLGGRARKELRPEAVVLLAGVVMLVVRFRPMDVGASLVFTVVLLVVGALGAFAVARAKTFRSTRAAANRPASPARDRVAQLPAPARAAPARESAQARLDGLLGDEEALSDLAVRQTPGGDNGDPLLPRDERDRPRRPPPQRGDLRVDRFGEPVRARPRRVAQRRFEPVADEAEPGARPSRTPIAAELASGVPGMRWSASRRTP